MKTNAQCDITSVHECTSNVNASNDDELNLREKYSEYVVVMSLLTAIIAVYTTSEFQSMNVQLMVSGRTLIAGSWL